MNKLDEEKQFVKMISRVMFINENIFQFLEWCRIFVLVIIIKEEINMLNIINV